MSDTTIDISDTLGTFKKELRMKDLGDGSLAIAVTDVLGLVNVDYDKAVINYTDATKVTISSVLFYRSGNLVLTLNQTVAATSDTWERA